MNRKFIFVDKKVVPLIFVTAFFFYFTSEAVLKQYLLSQMGAKKLGIDSFLAHLPKGIREDAEKRILKARLQDDLNEATTDAQVISATISLAKLESDEELEKAYAKILKKYPNAPEASSAFLYFFRRGSKLSIDEFHSYINRLPRINRFFVWQSGLDKLKRIGSTRAEKMEFLEPLLDIKPDYKDYQQLYVELAELARQNEDNDIESRAKKKKEACDNLLTIEQVMSEKKVKKQEKESEKK